jgi:hypothetical protein
MKLPNTINSFILIRARIMEDRSPFLNPMAKTVPLIQTPYLICCPGVPETPVMMAR